MPLPPAWYVLLIGVTLAAWPFLRRRAADPAARRFVAFFVGGLVLFEAGLVLLFYAKALCWPLVSLGVAAITLAGSRRPGLRVLLVLVPALIAGLAFELLAGERAFYFYFAFAIPLLLLVALVPACAPWVSLGKPRYQVAAGAVVAFAAFSPAAAFAFTFLVHYEIFQLPWLAVALGGLAVMTGPRGWAEAHAPRLATPRVTIAERLASPWTTRLALGAPLAVSGLAVGWLALRHAPLPAPFVAWVWGAIGVAVAGALLAATGTRWRSAGPGLVVAGMSGALAALAGVRFGAEAFHRFVGGGPAPESVYFYLAGAGLVLLALAGALGLARMREQAQRERLARDPSCLVHPDGLRPRSLPAGFLVERVAKIPSVRELAAFQARLATTGATGGVLEVAAPAADPLEGLPVPVSDWLAAQERKPLVHLAVREGSEVFLVPFIDPEEAT